MKLTDLHRIERNKLRRFKRQVRRDPQIEFPATVANAGLVIGMTGEERKAAFDKMRKAVE